MRIIYDDAMQSVMVEAVEKFMVVCNVKRITRYEYGMDRVQMNRMKEALNRFLESYYSMSIGNTVTHAHGIGNNCQYPVYYHPEQLNEIQQCGNININTGMFGEGYVYCEDYNGRKLGQVYEVRVRGITRKCDL